jgi:hypothetical protein
MIAIPTIFRKQINAEGSTTPSAPNHAGDRLPNVWRRANLAESNHLSISRFKWSIGMTEFAVMVERHLRLREIDGQTDVIVQIAAPVLDGNAYKCTYLIKGIGSAIPKSAFGIDGVQALQLALVHIGSELQAYEGEWEWCGNSFTGFPASVEDSIDGTRS